MDPFYYSSLDYDLDFLYSSIAEEQLLSSLNFDYPYPAVHHHIQPPLPTTQLDFDYCTLFPVLPTVEQQFSQSNYYLNEYAYEPPQKRHKNYHSSSTFVAPPPQPQQSCACLEKQHVNVRATAQSIAARERRKKISDKTRELGKLLPGPAAATKMNTAEMLQHAYDYVKFLQAQLSILKLMDSREQMQTVNIQILASKAVQEKLYTKDKCLVPVDFVDHLPDDEDVHSQDSISKLLMN